MYGNKQILVASHLTRGASINNQSKWKEEDNLHDMHPHWFHHQLLTVNSCLELLLPISRGTAKLKQTVVRNVITFLYQTYIWVVYNQGILLRTNNKRHMLWWDMICAQNEDTILDLIANTIERVCAIAQRERESSLWPLITFASH